MKGIKVTISTDVPIVDDVIYSVTNEVKCDWNGCNCKKLASEFDKYFFTATDVDCISNNHWTKYNETFGDSKVFATEAEAIQYKELNPFEIAMQSHFFSMESHFYAFPI